MGLQNESQQLHEEMATRSENSDTESNETWNISGNEIRSEGSEVVFLENNNDVVRTILMTRRRGGTIKIENNKIISTGGGRVGICKIGKNYYNWGVLIFLLVLIFGLANWEKSTATQSTMSRLTILISHGGSWVHSTYKNGKTKGVIVSKKITLEELRNKVYDIANLGSNEYEIIMKVIYDSTKNARPVAIVDDDDVRIFITESISRSYKIPLCITLKRRLSNQQATVDFRQLPMSVDLNLDTRADLEDNNQYRDSENYLGEEEL
ncbi:uncharacterized protein LOC117615392 [Prunus dulcis]|uniref:uncharacterized protein LOC117615392 n=1 Tax=Prunus dulcis TaxID=3755 RepID=UPI0014835D43|nr:uncharacterized protein LOC117615392 [Prunus dulcis]